MVFRIILAFLATFPLAFAEAVREGKTVEVAIGIATATFLRKLAEIFGLASSNLVAMAGAADLELLDEET